MRLRLQRNQSHQHGFTIVELLIATLVFSVVLLIVATSVITFSRQFYKGRVINNTQNVTRSAVNEISQTIQFSNISSISHTISPSFPDTQEYCINGKPYFYVIGRQLGDGMNGTAKAVLVTIDDDCGVPIPNLAQNGISDLDPGKNPRELLGQRMRLAKFDITQPNTLYEVSITVAYGSDDLLCVPTATGTGCVQPTTDAQWRDAKLTCRPGSGNQYCGVIRLTSSVAKRLY